MSTEFLRKYPVITKPTARNSSGRLCISVYNTGPDGRGSIAQALLCRGGKRYQRRLTLRRAKDGKTVWTKKAAFEELGKWLDQIRDEVKDPGLQKIVRRSKNRKQK